MRAPTFVRLRPDALCGGRSVEGSDIASQRARFENPATRRGGLRPRGDGAGAPSLPRGYGSRVRERVCIAERHHGVLRQLAIQVIRTAATALTTVKVKVRPGVAAVTACSGARRQSSGCGSGSHRRLVAPLVSWPGCRSFVRWRITHCFIGGGDCSPSRADI